ncbi:MAG TPA: spermidine/putrescine ABC transporter substrate-binding protein [Burkholderiaceae bacterium]
MKTDRGRARASRMAALALAAVLLVAACGRNSEPPSQGKAADAAAAARPGGELHWYNWNDYIDPQTVRRFEQETGAKVVQTYYSDNDEMLAKLAAGASGYDLIVPTGNALEVLIRQDQLQPLDKSRLPLLGNLKPEFTNTPFDPGNKYSVPYAYSVTIIGYNDQALKRAGVDAPTGWEAVFDPKLACRLKGKMTVLDSPDEVFAAAFIYLGIDSNTTSSDDYKKAAELIRKAKPCWAAFNSSSYIKEMSAGNIWLALGYSTDFFQAERAAQAAKQPFHIVTVLPTQGATLGLDNLVLAKSAPNPALAYAFINFLLDGRNGAELTNLIGSGNVNAAAMQFVSPEIKSNTAVFPPTERFKTFRMLNLLPPTVRQERGRLWTEIKAR